MNDKTKPVPLNVIDVMSDAAMKLQHGCDSVPAAQHVAAELNECMLAVIELAAAAHYVVQRTNGEVNGYSRLAAAVARIGGAP